MSAAAAENRLAGTEAALPSNAVACAGFGAKSFSLASVLPVAST
jgi:hypothetical protein